MTPLLVARRSALGLAVGLALSACTGGGSPSTAGSAPPSPAPAASAPPSAPSTPSTPSTPGTTGATPSTPGATPTGAPSDTLFGAAYRVTRQEPAPLALERTDERLGRLDVVRVFNDGAPPPWPGKAPGRNVVVSFKLDPAGVTAGQFDDEVRDWFRAAPQDLDVHWSYYHEPEDDIEDGRFTAEQYRAAFVHLARLADEAAGPRTRSALILQSYTTRPASGRDWRDYYPGDEAVDVFAWDVYNRPERAGGYTAPAELMGEQVEISRSVGKPFAVAELGSVLAPGDAGEGRAQWLREVGDYLKAQDAVFVTYFDLAFDGGRSDYRLLDEPSLQAWRDVTGSAS